MRIGLLLYCLLLWLAIAAGCRPAQQPSGEKQAEQQLLTLGTFNVEWLGDGINDRKPRTEEELRRLAEVIRQSGADILGLQEVENKRALERLLRFLPEFSGFVGSLGGQQNVALIYRNGLHVQLVGEYTPLIVQPGRTRPGLLAYCRAGSVDFYVMVVHLKSSSRYDSTEELREIARQLRQQQAQRLAQWVDSMLQVGSERDIALIGDFNDTPRRKRYPTLTPLVEHPALQFLTTDLRSCRYERAYTIDHIVVTHSFARRYRRGSAHVVNFYAQYPFAEAEAVSDHCPVVAQFELETPDDD